MDEIMNTIRWLIDASGRNRADDADRVPLGNLAEGYTAQKQALEFLVLARGRLETTQRCFSQKVE